jgi:hypothetical protein
MTGSELAMSGGAALKATGNFPVRAVALMASALLVKVAKGKRELYPRVLMIFLLE